MFSLLPFSFLLFLSSFLYFFPSLTLLLPPSSLIPPSLLFPPSLSSLLTYFLLRSLLSLLLSPPYPQVVRYAQLLLDGSLPLSVDDIGIITPYRKQVEKIRMFLKITGIEGIKVSAIPLSIFPWGLPLSSHGSFPYMFSWGLSLYLPTGASPILSCGFPYIFSWGLPQFSHLLCICLLC